MSDLIHVYFSNWNLSININLIILLLIFLLVIIFIFLYRKIPKIVRYDLVKLNISLGNIGQVEFCPSIQDIQIAHQIWTELVTRKAAIPIDPENDVITEIYDSWYELFKKIRSLICDLPGNLVRKKDTQKLVRIATETLNKGLRPHLTKWHARFRTWFEQNSYRLKDLSPQELQREYPEYDQLITDLKKVNQELIQYSDELQKIILDRYDS